MEYYYHCPKELWLEWGGRRNHFAEHHWVPTDEEGIIFLVCSFRHKNDRWIWEALPTVEPFPHPEDPAGHIGGKHAARLKRYGVYATHRTVEAAELAAKIHPLMRWGGV